MLCLSDSSALSDNPQDIRSPLVRFFRLIGQPARHSLSACPILPPYRTTRKTFALRLSDSSTLSDNPQDIRSPLVRFFRLIGQPARHSLSACPIPHNYRTFLSTSMSKKRQAVTACLSSNQFLLSESFVGPIEQFF